MNATHLGGKRSKDPLTGWRALAAAIILQALRDVKESPPRCYGQPFQRCYRDGCSRCAWLFLNSKEGLDLLSAVLGRRCSRKRLRALLKNGSFYIPDNPRKYDPTVLKEVPQARNNFELDLTI